MFYQAKLSWYQENEKGGVKKKNKSFIVEAISVSDAETKMVDYSSKPNFIGKDVITFLEPKVESVKEIEIQELIEYPSDKWWEFSLYSLTEKGKRVNFKVFASGDEHKNLVSDIDKSYSNYGFKGVQESTFEISEQLIESFNKPQ